MRRTVPRIWRQLHARPRLYLAAALALVLALFLPATLVPQPLTRWLLGWDAGVVVYVALIAAMMARSAQEALRRRARIEDEGRYVVLALAVLAAVASLAAIAGELATVKDLHGAAKAWRVALAAFTVLSSWVFVHLMFAIHYAHDYALALEESGNGGLAFAGEAPPDYADFAYFSFVIGTSGQTADVAFTSRAMRRLGLAHCVLAFLFNTTVLALTINIAASLL